MIFNAAQFIGCCLRSRIIGFLCRLALCLSLFPIFGSPSFAVGRLFDSVPYVARESRADGYRVDLLAKAQPDECFVGIGQPRPDGPPCEQGVPKVNEAYIWGMTQDSRGRLWFGTVANYICANFVATSFLSDVVGDIFGGSSLANVNSSYVCEFEQSVSNPGRPSLGDWRPPNVYMYDPDARQLKNATPDDPVVQRTFGFRAAGYHDGLIFMAGQHFDPDTGFDGLTMLAFDAESSEYLGSKVFGHLTNARQFTVVDNYLYVGVKELGEGDPLQGYSGGGSILRWNGSRLDPFAFVEVGRMNNEPAYLAEHKGRLYANTWASVNAGMSELFMSPALNEKGFLAQDQAENWTSVWNVGEYEPDPLIARTYLGGAMASYGDYLFWGTMSQPIAAAGIYMLVYPELIEGSEQPLAAAARIVLNGAVRASAIFRGRNFEDESREVDLLYGAETMPTYMPPGDDPFGQRDWRDAPNLTGSPLFGKAGFGNPSNTYLWSMAEHDGELFVGTADGSWMVRTVLFEGLPSIGDLEYGPFLNWLADPSGFQPYSTHGADVYRFPSPDKPAILVTKDGFGNLANFGIRSMVSTPEALYMGTANPMNLMTDPKDDLPEGGWELLKVYRNK